MPPAIGTGDAPPAAADPLALRALAAYERHLARLRTTPGHLLDPRDELEVGRASLADAGADYLELSERFPIDDVERERAALVRAFPDPAERAAFLERSAAAARWLAREAAGPSLDTWEHLNIGNSSEDDEAPARARDDSPLPLGQPSPEAARDDWQAERVRRYDRAKAELAPAIRAAAGALAAIDPDAPGPAFLERMADAVGGCRDVRAFRDGLCGAHLARPLSCDVRLCPDCERARSAAFLERLASVRAGMARPVSITLTVPNVPAGFLGLGVDMLTDAWARLRRTAMLAGGYCRGAHQDPDERRAGELPPHREPCGHPTHREPAARACSSCNRRHGDPSRRAPRGACDAFAPVACRCARCSSCRRCRHGAAAGGVAALEVTYSEDRGDWHPHLHVVADLPDYLPHAELRDAWRAATCDAYRAAMERGADTGRSAGYRRPERKGRVKLERCRHLADRLGRPADTACAAGHGWRARDADRCPYQDRDMAAPCGSRGTPIPEPARCRGASQVWIARAKDEDGATATAAALREAIKYATKGLIGKDGAIVAAVRERPALLAELLLTLRNRRLVNGWGTYHGITDDAPDEDAGPDLVPVETGELFDKLGQPIPSMLPRLCPACRQEALWEYQGRRRRAECVPRSGQLYWRPPATAGPRTG